MESKGRIFLIGSDFIMRNYLRNFISHFDRPIHTPSDSISFWTEFETMKSDISLVIYDLSGITSETLQSLDRLRDNGASLPIILLAGQTQIPLLQAFSRLSSWKIVTKPFLPQEFKSLVHGLLGGAISREQDRSVHSSAPKNVNQTGYHPQLLLGVSRRMDEVKAIIDHVANTDVTVLIRGESGTGKELTARSLYECSNRVGKPFVTVLCPAIPEALLESELFGYEKGSFTGAFRRRPGKFEIANQGTIFLDEIGDIPFSLQSKLLHVLQGGEFARLGGTELKVNVRIVAATNKDLEKAVAEGTFREDLYYRLNVVSIYVPALRERKEDIPLLIDSFLNKYNSQYNRHQNPLSESSLAMLMDHDWPGNIRELENVIKRIVIMGGEKTVIQQHLSEGAKRVKTETIPVAAREEEVRKPVRENRLGTDNGIPSLKYIGKEAMKRAEGEAILRTLEQTRWNRKAAARLLKISYKALLYKIRQCNLDQEPDPSEKGSK